MLKWATKLRVCLTWLLVVTCGCPPQVFAGDPLFGGWGKTHSRPKSRLEQLAESVDQLEREIDCYGSIVIKQPDVWGEARWTSHRQEFEKTMFKELERFKFTLNAQITESDTSFATLAASLSAASGTAVVQATSAQTMTSQSLTPLPAQRPDVYAPNGDDNKGITVEPTVYLDQMARYIKHLHQLRRINEGDDTADASGYALNLMRIPASILPGSKTRTGYGAELTVTVTPELSEDLLPETFKDLVFNDLVDQLSLPLLKVAEQKPWENQNTLEHKIEYEKEYTRYKTLAQTLIAIDECSNRNCGEIKYNELKDHINLAIYLMDSMFGKERCISAESIPYFVRIQIATQRDKHRESILKIGRKIEINEIGELTHRLSQIPAEIENRCDNERRLTDVKNNAPTLTETAKIAEEIQKEIKNENIIKFQKWREDNPEVGFSSFKDS